jgi:hypothetical protein
MRLTQKTLVLLAVLIALLGLNLVDSGNTYSLDSDLPALPAMPADALTRIEVSTASSKTILVQEDGVWMVTAPYEARADQALLQRLVATFRKETVADVRVDTGNLDEYGLDTTNGIVAEYWLDGEAPAASLTIGYDAPGGASFVRLSGDEAVYRMRVGGRHSYDIPPIAWRNRVLLDYDYTQAQAFEIDQSGEELTRFVRGTSPGLDESGVPIPGEWGLDPAVSWQVDQYRVEAMVRAMGMLRAGGLLGSDFVGAFSQPKAKLTVTLDDGTTREMLVSSRRQDNSGFVQVGEEAFQVSASRLDLALQPREAFQDLTIFAFARTDIDTMSLEEGPSRVILQQSAGGESWSVLQPENVDVDLKRVYFAVNTLRELRAVSIIDVPLEQAGLLDPSARISVRMLSGQELTLEIGREVLDAAGERRVLVRRADSARVYSLPPETVEKLKRGFGRG